MGPGFESPAGHQKTTRNNHVSGGFLLISELFRLENFFISDLVDNLLQTANLFYFAEKVRWIQMGIEFIRSFDVGMPHHSAQSLGRNTRFCGHCGKSMARQFDMSKAVDIVVGEDGKERFKIYMNLGVGKTKRFRTAWIKDTQESAPRIVTASREDKGSD